MRIYEYTWYIYMNIKKRKAKQKNIYIYYKYIRNHTKRTCATYDRHHKWGAGCESRGEKGRERVGGSERYGEKKRRNIERFFFFIRYSVSSSMREDIIRDRALTKGNTFQPSSRCFPPSFDRSNENNETDPSLSHKNCRFLIEILFDKKEKIIIDTLFFLLFFFFYIHLLYTIQFIIFSILVVKEISFT